MAAIGRLPDTLADRCILIRMQRKTSREHCDRLRDLDTTELRQKCLRFAADHAAAVASARPEIPPSLNDRAADIWEPLLALADLAAGPWPALARQAAVNLTATAHDSNPIGALLLDIFIIFVESKADRLFSRDLLDALNQRFSDRPWTDLRKGRQITDLWLAQMLRPYGVRPRNIHIAGIQAKGYLLDEFKDVFRRYISRAELDALKEPEPAPSGL
jgi:putative DNA primase/helicase